ncbi:MAG: hypothetical protein KIT25_19695 [Enhydrobacter sp.]|nr:MAG: hypothetical protein KIT25_19695 [Enhydrobacter sp.]
MKHVLFVLPALLLAACQLPTNVALLKVDELRAAQNACLSGNVVQFDDGVTEASRIGRFVAMSCTVQTDKLVQYAIPHANRTEREAFEHDAALRATGFVLRARGQPRS